MLAAAPLSPAPLFPLLDGALPAGVVELSAPRALGATALAARAVALAHARDARAFCAWCDPDRTLHAPGLAQRGVDLARLLVFCPTRKDASRAAVKAVASGAFDVVVIDVDAAGETGARRRGEPLFVRKLALGAEKSGATVVLLVDALARKPEPWPVALRLEIERAPDALFVRVGKDRHGRLGLAKARVPMELVDAG